MPPDVGAETVNVLLNTAKDALKRLLYAVCSRTTCRASHHAGQPFLCRPTHQYRMSHTCDRFSDAVGSDTITNIHVLVSFDEAQVLANQLESPGSSLAQPGKTALDILFPLLDDFRELGLFAVFLSTQPYIEHLASGAPFHCSTHHVHPRPYGHAPLIETPFDCFGDREVVPSCLRAEDLCDVAFMACFGRPM